ncbi:glycosyltransferase [Kaistella pullorum]|uniref:Glycosyltransferase n=1 Tax=Kaistella pullorum TaxID=2763074 RepID=A0ABR8WP86_9FLAO|nr:glycosyltransferase [Kaistella pullorum]MBD8018757.1 glycosyltransferase [Kaistella pullorum]
MSHRTISFIIVTYKSQRDLPGAFDSICQFLDIDKESLEVIVVDNSPEPEAAETRTITENHPLAGIVSLKYIRNTKNLGYGQGNNVGIEASRGDLICIMNPDVCFREPLLKDVLKHFQDNKLGLLGFKQLGGMNYSFYIKPEYRNSIYGFTTKILNRLDLFFPKYCYLSGAFFFVDKSKFKEVGMFDENIFMYFEEPDIANRLQNGGYKIRFNSGKSYLHLVEDRVSWQGTSFHREMESLIYYREKYKINTHKYYNMMKNEVKIKSLVASLLGDKVRSHKFVQERQMIEDFEGPSKQVSK